MLDEVQVRSTQFYWSSPDLPGVASTLAVVLSARLLSSSVCRRRSNDSGSLPSMLLVMPLLVRYCRLSNSWPASHMRTTTISFCVSVPAQQMVHAVDNRCSNPFADVLPCLSPDHG